MYSEAMFLLITITCFSAGMLWGQVNQVEYEAELSSIYEGSGINNKCAAFTGLNLPIDPLEPPPTHEDIDLWWSLPRINENSKLLASDAQAVDHFGEGVSILGHVAVIGAPMNDDMGIMSGSAYVYRYNGASWWEETKLLAADGQAGDRFGRTVSIWGNVAVIGANFDDDLGLDSGSAYIFHHDGLSWQWETKLLASDGQPGDYFGRCVYISNGVIVVGSQHDDDSGISSGSAYIFNDNGGTWEEETKLIASDGEADDQFGIAVCISGDVVLIGAPRDDDLGSNSGSAYIFRFDGEKWLEEAKLLASDGETGDYFGRRVSISGDVAVLGAPLSDDDGLSSGSVYIFRYDGETWTEETKLLALDADVDDMFGRAVSVSGNSLVIGAYHDDDSGYESGSAYYYLYNSTFWEEKAKLLASDGGEEDYFGEAVSLSGTVALIGVFKDNDLGHEAGSAYIFEFADPTNQPFMFAH
jgi:hypothetical protein